LKKFDYKEIKLSENKNYILINAKKIMTGIFSMWLLNTMTSPAMFTSPFIFWHLYQKATKKFILKLLNHLNFYEKEAKYLLCLENQIISCSTSNSILNCRCSIGELADGI